MCDWPYTTKRWLRLRRLKLQQHPLCEFCLQVGAIEPATAVDHRLAISRGGAPFPALDGLSSLCERHHNAKTNAERNGEDYERRGCDIFGRPNDADHPWNKNAS